MTLFLPEKSWSLSQSLKEKTLSVCKNAAVKAKTSVNFPRIDEIVDTGKPDQAEKGLFGGGFRSTVLQTVS